MGQKAQFFVAPLAQQKRLAFLFEASLQLQNREARHPSNESSPGGSPPGVCNRCILEVHFLPWPRVVLFYRLCPFRIVVFSEMYFRGGGGETFAWPTQAFAAWHEGFDWMFIERR